MSLCWSVYEHGPRNKSLDFRADPDYFVDRGSSRILCQDTA